MRPCALLEGCLRRYGDAFTLRLLGFGERGFSDVVFLTHPDIIKAVFTAGADQLRVGALREPMAPMFGRTSILLLDGTKHMRQRKLLLPPFHGARMAAYAGLIAEATEREVARWPRERPFALQPGLQAITLEVILVAVFGLEDPERRARVGGAIREALGMVANPLSELLMGLPGKVGPVNIRAPFELAVAEMDALLLAEIARRRSDPKLAERDDILSLLMQARDEDGNAMSDRELRDELVTLLLAGHETTATALAWTFDELLHNPTALGALHEDENDEYLTRSSRRFCGCIRRSLSSTASSPQTWRRPATGCRRERSSPPASTSPTAGPISIRSPMRSALNAFSTGHLRPMAGCPLGEACASLRRRELRHVRDEGGP